MKGELWHIGLLINYVDIQGEGVHRLFVQTRGVGVGGWQPRRCPHSLLTELSDFFFFLEN